jgi:50S ribosomal subunit-associated GTPase HflX
MARLVLFYTFWHDTSSRRNTFLAYVLTIEHIIITATAGFIQDIEPWIVNARID